MYAYKEEIQVTRDIPNPFTSKLQEIQKQFIKKKEKKVTLRNFQEIPIGNLPT